MEKCLEFLSLELTRIQLIPYFSDLNAGFEQLASCLIIKAALKDPNPKLQHSIRAFNHNKDYAKRCTIELLHDIHRFIDMPNAQVIFVTNQDHLQFPFVETKRDEADFDAITKHMEEEFGVRLFSDKEEDCLSVLLGKYDRNLQCESEENKSVFISCHVALVLQRQHESLDWTSNPRFREIDLQSLLLDENLVTEKIADSKIIRERLRGASFVTEAAKRKANSIEFTIYKITEYKLSGIFLKLWIYACQIMLKGAGTRQNRRQLARFIQKGEHFDISFHWYRPLGFFMRRSAQWRYQARVKENTYYQYVQTNSDKQVSRKTLRNVLIGGGVAVVVPLALYFGYKQWKPQQ